jgi:hypothetical protein
MNNKDICNEKTGCVYKSKLINCIYCILNLIQRSKKVGVAFNQQFKRFN